MLKLFAKRRSAFYLFGAISLLLITYLGCESHAKNSGSDTSTSPQISNSDSSQQYQTPSSPSTSAKQDDDDEEESDGSSGIEDGTYSATVDYYNPTTGYSATYTLDVVVANGQVVQINFPNDGYLDEDHISPADVDEDGNANVEGEDGKTYGIHIDI